ncbi:Rpn family recombination-promoting nuclease/putative transposase [Spirulina subsalsa]|uniref:Rpn family recombination-promoting nuclease/putative transposase n=1 Tax=Spirulina subsalsa TaxID=54311 RepID=UPI0002DD5A3F|nr:Rpn family recombination-promoting nuclease/putative transposase [Spirulina subsalsa]
MKTDTIFYRIFKELPNTLFDLLGQSPTPDNPYRFESIEIKQTAFRIDGVFFPQTITPQTPLYFTEVQFQKDPNLYARLFSELFLYLRTNHPQAPWRAVILFRSPNIEPTPRERLPYEPLLNSPWVTRIYLNDLQQEENPRLSLRILQLLVARSKEIRPQVKSLVEQVEQEVGSQRNREQVLDLIETIVLYKLPQISRQELGEMFSVENLKKTRFAQEMKQEGREEGLQQGREQGLQQGREQGLQQGREQGLQQGREQMKQQLIHRLTERGMSPAEIADLLELDLTVVQQILKSSEN